MRRGFGDVPIPSAAHVLGPTMPSTARLWVRWKSRTASSVIGPKMPSAIRLRARWRVATSPPSAAFTDCLHFGLMCYELMIVMSFRGGGYCRIHNGTLIRTPPLRK